MHHIKSLRENSMAGEDEDKQPVAGLLGTAQVVMVMGSVTLLGLAYVSFHILL